MLLFISHVQGCIQDFFKKGGRSGEKAMLLTIFAIFPREFLYFSTNPISLECLSIMTEFQKWYYCFDAEAEQVNRNRWSDATDKG